MSAARPLDGPDSVPVATDRQRAEQNIQLWKIKKLIKQLDAARGCVISRYTLRPPIERDVVQRGHVHDQSHHPAKGMLLTALWNLQ